LLVGSEAARRSVVARFRAVVGSIVLLAEPLSIRSLARLLDIPEDTVFRRYHIPPGVPTVLSSPPLSISFDEARLCPNTPPPLGSFPGLASSFRVQPYTEQGLYVLALLVALSAINVLPNSDTRLTSYG
jgi:hypothetical protein